ncbi:tetratricopeptide repeat protein [Treponema sp.]
MAGSLREGVRLYRSKRYDIALGELLQVDSSLSDDDDNAELAYYLGLCYTRLSRYDDALLYLEQVVTSGSDILRSYQCRMALAYVYSVTGRSRLAEFELKHLIDKGYESVQIYSAMGHAAWTQKKVDGALDYYRRALDLEGENPTALNGLGFVLADSEQDPRKALSLCKKAVDYKPQNPAYLDSLGWAHYKNGNIPEARTWLRRALDLAPRQMDIKAHMKIVVGE